MAYSFKSVTIRTDNSEGGMTKINELWADIMTGKVPLDFIKNGMPVKGLSPVSVYSDYESNEHGKYNLSVMTVTVAPPWWRTHSREETEPSGSFTSSTSRFNIFPS